MCLLAVYFHAVEDAPVIVGANREEFYDRGGEAPQILDGPLCAVGGIDPAAGGTWLGVNERGVLAAVTNRARSHAPAQPRSRGLLVRDLLACPNALTAVDLAAKELSSQRYAGCNLLIVDRSSAYVLHAGDWLRVRPLPTGVHVLTARDVNDESDRRIGHALWWLTRRDDRRSGECVAALKELCAQTGNGDPPICLRGPKSGTVSSSIVVLGRRPGQTLYLHAQGPPHKTPYADYSYLFDDPRMNPEK